MRDWTVTHRPCSLAIVKKLKRCAWAETDDLLRTYHDEEWGVPEHDDRRLFEMLNLEGAQAGLSWLIVLRKRPRYRRVFDNFRAEKIVRYSAAKRAKLLLDPGIVRNRLKIAAVVENARAYLAVQKECGSFDAYLWAFVNGKPLTSSARAHEVANQLSRDLKRRGFRFVGPTIVYAFMQATGLVNDHARGCFRR